jgi:hypothetical protein
MILSLLEILQVISVPENRFEKLCFSVFQEAFVINQEEVFQDIDITFLIDTFQEKKKWNLLKF